MNKINQSSKSARKALNVGNDAYHLIQAEKENTKYAVAQKIIDNLVKEGMEPYDAAILAGQQCNLVHKMASSEGYFRQIRSELSCAKTTTEPVLSNAGENRLIDEWDDTWEEWVLS